MEALYLLVPLSVAIVVLAAWIFLRMSDSGQFDDMEGPAHSILHDDDRPPEEAEERERAPLDATQKLSTSRFR
ncbi:MAG TPA: cbb3-type cytochrome oxidase assembly protein CcoS [Zeimonas sp.]|nr:cbb3-type cytochrome oxidase assembly protein CcoS [Zeimonas sp.]